jgi:hypothetical protein
MKANVIKSSVTVLKQNILLQPDYPSCKTGTYDSLIFVNHEYVKCGGQYLCKYILDIKTTHHSES